MRSSRARLGRLRVACWRCINVAAGVQVRVDSRCGRVMGRRGDGSAAFIPREKAQGQDQADKYERNLFVLLPHRFRLSDASKGNKATTFHVPSCTPPHDLSIRATNEGAPKVSRVAVTRDRSRKHRHDEGEGSRVSRFPHQMRICDASLQASPFIDHDRAPGVLYGGDHGSQIGRNIQHTVAKVATQM